jgi:hypothetical protein
VCNLCAGKSARVASQEQKTNKVGRRPVHHTRERI